MVNNKQNVVAKSKTFKDLISFLYQISPLATRGNVVDFGAENLYNAIKLIGGVADSS